MADGPNINALFSKYFDLTKYRNLHWTGGFEDYLQIVKKSPDVSRNAFQRMFDMILSWGTEEYSRHKESRQTMREPRSSTRTIKGSR